MEFDFDPDKARSNLAKHGIAFSDAEPVFFDPLAMHQLDADACGEFRYIAIGLGGIGEILVVVYTHEDDSIRLISARKATRNEVKHYER